MAQYERRVVRTGHACRALHEFDPVPRTQPGFNELQGDYNNNIKPLFRRLEPLKICNVVWRRYNDTP